MIKHVIFLLPHLGVECECPQGYELSEDETHCQDINECELYDNENDEDSDDYFEDQKSQPQATFCSHTCTNLIGITNFFPFQELQNYLLKIPGSFICSCPENFHIHEDKRTCIRDYCVGLENEEFNKTKCSHECVDAYEGLFI